MSMPTGRAGLLLWPVAAAGSRSGGKGCGSGSAVHQAATPGLEQSHHRLLYAHDFWKSLQGCRESERGGREVRPAHSTQALAGLETHLPVAIADEHSPAKNSSSTERCAIDKQLAGGSWRASEWLS